MSEFTPVTRPLSMAAGIMPGAMPRQLVEAAAYGGYDFGGMWIEQDDWTPATTRAVKTHLQDAGVQLLDAEVAWIKEGEADPWLSTIVDIAAELGAANVLCVSSDPDTSATAAKFQTLLDRAKGTGVRVNLEFGIFTKVPRIGDARAILEQVEGHKGLLCDTLHWTRSGGTVQELQSVPREWLGYAQLCDGPADPPDFKDEDDVIADAVDRRMPLGAGGLPIAAMVDALPANLPVAVEERSLALREAFPDYNERAKEVARTSREWLARHDRAGS